MAVATPLSVEFIEWRCGSMAGLISSPAHFHRTLRSHGFWGEDLFLDPKRVYSDFRTMAAEEAKLPQGERIDFVSIVTPNRMHVPVATVFLETGFDVVCDKPVAFDLKEALALREVVRKTGKVFVLTHNYTGYPMVKEAREFGL